MITDDWEIALWVVGYVIAGVCLGVGSSFLCIHMFIRFPLHTCFVVTVFVVIETLILRKNTQEELTPTPEDLMVIFVALLHMSHATTLLLILTRYGKKLRALWSGDAIRRRKIRLSELVLHMDLKSDQNIRDDLESIYHETRIPTDMCDLLAEFIRQGSSLSTEYKRKRIEKLHAENLLTNILSHVQEDPEVKAIETSEQY